MSKVSTSIRTSTKIEGKTKKVIVEETITYSDGHTEVNTSETVTEASDCRDSEKSVVSQTMSEFRDDALTTHNALRSKHCAPALKAAYDLSEYAQKHADHMAATGDYTHSDGVHNDGSKLGENIACKWSSNGADYTGKEVVEYWYSEISKHDFNTASPSGSGHFSQVVWKGTNEMGIGKARDKDGKVYVVASYRPAGNYVGKFSENVLPPTE